MARKTVTARLVALGLLLFPVWVAAEEGKAEVEALQSLVEAYARSVTNLDMDLAARIWDDSDQVSFIHPRGHQRGWPDIRQSFYLETMGQMKARRLTVRDVTVRLISADSAWGDFYWDFEATFPDGESIRTSGRETQVWRKAPDGWKIQHVHYSGMPVTGEREGL